MVVFFFYPPGVPSVAGVLSALRSLAFIPISFTLAYVVRGEKLTMSNNQEGLVPRLIGKPGNEATSQGHPPTPWQ